MTTGPEQPITMPTKSQLVAEAVARFDVLGLRSSLLALDSQTLADLGLRLTDRNVSVREASTWLNTELGGSEGEGTLIPERNVYRFADAFRRVYGQVRSEHARRVARLSIEHATAGNVDSMAQVATNQLVNLIAEKFVDTDDYSALSGTELSGAIATLSGLANQKIKQAELALKAAEGQRKAAKLEADLAKMQAQLLELQSQNEVREAQRRKAAITARDQVHAVSQSSGTVSRDQVLEILDKVMKGEA